MRSTRVSPIRRWTLLGIAGLAAAVAAALLWRELFGPPAAFRNRQTLPSCGTAEAIQRQPAGPAVDCFEQAMRRGEPSELLLRIVTTEGDPIAHYYRTVPGEPGLEVFVDTTEDRYGPHGWSHRRCPDARSITDLGACTDV
jgi:hypothetical protein